MSSRLSGSIVESTVGQRRCKEGDMELFRSGIFYPILDCLSFSKSNCSIMQGIQALNPKSRNFLMKILFLALLGFMNVILMT